MAKLFLTTFVAWFGLAQGHYTFLRLRHNGEWKEPIQYIRFGHHYTSSLFYLLANGINSDKTAPYRETPLWNTNVWERGYQWPTYYLDEPNSVRCGRGNMDHAADTEVLTVQAGDTFEIAQIAAAPSEWREEYYADCPDDLGFCNSGASHGEWTIIHPGPVIVHLGKVPDGQEIATYDGSGEWLKIYTKGLEWREEESPETPIYWLPFNNRGTPPRFVFQIPAQTPPGQYLMRMDQVNPGLYPDGLSLAELYPTCAQLNIQSNSTAALPAGVKIPEAMIHHAPGMYCSRAMSNGSRIDPRWEYPGGPIWDGETLTPDIPVV
ncbi:hypothetical protein S40288_00925 [Stachybotrys chartarum IBT 40288]|nr:hypothetical protein S40288_00925 [Stachybotrys chartarum IBT 40288]